MTISLTGRQQQILDLIRKAIAQTGFPPTRAELAHTLGYRSPNAAEDHLRALAKKGVIELTAGASRGIRLTAAARQFSAEFEGQDEINETLRGEALQTDALQIDELRAEALQAEALQADSLLDSTSTRHQKILLRDLPGAGNILLPLIGRVAAGFPILATENIEKELSVDPDMFSQRPDYLLKVKGLSMRDAGILDGDLLAIKKTSEARHGQIVVARIDDEVTVKRLSKQGSVLELLPENPDFEPIVLKPGQDFSIEGIALGLIRNTPLH